MNQLQYFKKMMKKIVEFTQLSIIQNFKLFNSRIKINNNSKILNNNCKNILFRLKE